LFNGTVIVSDLITLTKDDKDGHSAKNAKERRTIAVSATSADVPSIAWNGARRKVGKTKIGLLLTVSDGSSVDE
jgi:hypothetical protein